MSQPILEQEAFFYAKEMSKNKNKRHPTRCHDSGPGERTCYSYVFPLTWGCVLEHLRRHHRSLGASYLGSAHHRCHCVAPTVRFAGRAETWVMMPRQPKGVNKTLQRWAYLKAGKITYKSWHPEAADVAVLPETGLRFQDWTVYLMDVERQTKADEANKGCAKPSHCLLSWFPSPGGVWLIVFCRLADDPQKLSRRFSFSHSSNQIVSSFPRFQ